MNYYVVAALGTAGQYASTVDASLGYPKTGVNVGGGVHVPGPFVTRTWQAQLANPSGLLWAYPADSVTTAVLAGTGGLPVPIALDATWVNATAIVPVVVALPSVAL